MHTGPCGVEHDRRRPETGEAKRRFCFSRKGSGVDSPCRRFGIPQPPAARRAGQAHPLHSNDGAANVPSPRSIATIERAKPVSPYMPETADSYRSGLPLKASFKAIRMPL